MKTANWLNHLEYDWQSPIWSHLLRALAAAAPPDPLRRARQRPLRLGRRRHLLRCLRARPGKRRRRQRPAERFRCWASRRAAPSRIAYAVRHPERVTHLVLLRRLCPRPAQARRASRDRAGRRPADPDAPGLGPGEPGVSPDLHVACSSRTPPPSRRSWFNDLQRITTSPENAARIREAHRRHRRHRAAAATCACRRWSCTAATTPCSRSRKDGGWRRGIPGVALRGAGRPQPHDPGARARPGPACSMK